MAPAFGARARPRDHPKLRVAVYSEQRVRPDVGRSYRREVKPRADDRCLRGFVALDATLMSPELERIKASPATSALIKE